jgi:hypothetical protein
VFAEAFALVIKYLERDPPDFLYDTGLVILDHIESAIPGLENHGKTYATDPMHRAQVDAFIESSQTKIADIRARQMHNDLDEFSDL